MAKRVVDHVIIKGRKLALLLCLGAPLASMVSSNWEWAA